MFEGWGKIATYELLLNLTTGRNMLWQVHFLLASKHIDTMLVRAGSFSEIKK